MSFSELLLIVFVILIVFGPKKLPMLASHLGRCICHYHGYKKKALALWQQQQNELQWQDNIEKAKKADAMYQEKSQ